MRYRAATLSDLSTFRSLLHPAFRVSDRVRARIEELWADLLVRDSIVFAVVEDPARRHPDSIRGFGATVFVSDSFAREFQARPSPYLSAIVYEEMVSGRSPVLSPREIARGHAGDGLDLVVLHFGLRNHDMSDERTQRTLMCASDAFYFFHAGYRIRSLMQEVYGSEQAEYMEAGGFRLMEDFGDHPDVSSGPADERRPRLFGLDRRSIRPGAVNTLSFLFHPRRPVLNLSGAVQRVLVRAMLHESDGQIAKALGISADAVKKTWRRAFDQVSRLSPGILGEPHEVWSDRRGAEKRHHLISYLRLHLEEVRPVQTRSGPASRARARNGPPRQREL